MLGEGAADDALVMIRDLGRFQTVSDGLVALSRIADRRWDLIYKTGLRVQLPESGVAQALDEAQPVAGTISLLDRDLDLIDMRVDGIVALRPTQREEGADGA